MRLESHCGRLPCIHYPTEMLSPLKLETWKKKLRAHLDQDFANYIIKGIENGFAMGVDCTKQIVSAKRNMQSALLNPAVLDKYLQLELAAGNISGLYTPGALHGL